MTACPAGEEATDACTAASTMPLCGVDNTAPWCCWCSCRCDVGVEEDDVVAGDGVGVAEEASEFAVVMVGGWEALVSPAPAPCPPPPAAPPPPPELEPKEGLLVSAGAANNAAERAEESAAAPALTASAMKGIGLSGLPPSDRAGRCAVPPPPNWAV